MSKKLSKIDTYTKDELIQIVNNSYSYAECLRKMGYSRSGGALETIKNRFNLLQIDTSHFRKKNCIHRTSENVFCENSTCSQHTLRDFYRKTNNVYICAICGQEPFWKGKPLTLILDHINGNNRDNRLENLRWVCPNCNMQLETTGSKKLKLQKKKPDKLIKYNLDRDTLKRLVRKENFTDIGNKYGVTRVAVRKWCSRFNLPTSSKEIKKYTDEEWELI